MRIFIIISVLLFSGIKLNGQTLQTFDAEALGQSPNELVREFFQCEGLEIQSLSVSAPEESIGKFSNGDAAISMSDGLILSTGLVTSSAEGIGADGNMEEFANYNNGVGGVNNFIDIINGGPNTNSSQITMQFVAKTDTLFLSYVFASEEFADYDCQRGKDAIAILMQGPGYDFKEGLGQIMSRLPNTNQDFITVENIHPETDFCTPANEEFYIANTFGNQPVYSGYTTVIKNALPLEIGQIYKITIILGDHFDTSKDSALFIDFETRPNPFCHIPSPDPQTLVEGCSDPITLSLNGSEFPESIFPIQWELVGTAQVNEDYLVASPSGILVNISDELNFTLDPIADDTAEPVEEVILRLTAATGETFDYYWFISDPLSTLSIQPGQVCNSYDNNLYLDGNLEDLPSYTISGTANYDFFYFRESYSFPVEGIPFDYLASEFQIEEFCLRAESKRAFTFYLISPDEKRIELFGTHSQNKQYDICFSPESNYHASDFISNYGENFPIPSTVDLYPEDDFNALSNAKVNGIWRLELHTNTNTEESIKLLDYSITFRQTQSPNIPLLWNQEETANHDFINVHNLPDSQSYYSASAVLDNCNWKDSIPVQRDVENVTEYQVSICHKDSINIVGHDFHSGSLNKLIIYENEMDGACDSLVDIEVNLVYPSFSVQEYFIPLDSSIQIGDSILSHGPHHLIIRNATELGCDSMLFINVFTPQEIIAPAITQTAYEIIDTTCTSGENRWIKIDDIELAGFYDYNIFLNDEHIGPVSDHSTSLETVGLRCQNLNNVGTRLVRFDTDILPDIEAPGYFYQTNLQYLNILNQLSYPEYTWVYLPSANQVCAYPDINVGSSYSHYYDFADETWDTYNFMSSSTVHFPTAFVLNVAPGTHQIVLDSPLDQAPDTIDLSYSSILPSGNIDSLYIVSELNATTTWPILMDDLCGPILNSEIICNDADNSSVNFSLAQHILEFNAYDYGGAYTCIRACDDLGVCDTLWLSVQIPDPSNAYSPFSNIKISVFPNPVIDDECVVQANVNLNERFDYKLINHLGQSVKAKEASSFPFSLSTKNIPNGIYYLQLFKDGVLLTMEKIVVAR